MRFFFLSVYITFKYIATILCSLLYMLRYFEVKSKFYEQKSLKIRKTS